MRGLELVCSCLSPVKTHPSEYTKLSSSGESLFRDTRTFVNTSVYRTNIYYENCGISQSRKINLTRCMLFARKAKFLNQIKINFKYMTENYHIVHTNWFILYLKFLCNIIYAFSVWKLYHRESDCRTIGFLNIRTSVWFSYCNIE